MSTFTNKTDRLLTFPQLGLSIAAGESHTAENEAQAEALRRSPILEESASKSEAKRRKAQEEETPSEDAE